MKNSFLKFFSLQKIKKFFSFSFAKNLQSLLRKSITIIIFTATIILFYFFTNIILIPFWGICNSIFFFFLLLFCWFFYTHNYLYFYLSSHFLQAEKWEFFDFDFEPNSILSFEDFNSSLQFFSKKFSINYYDSPQDVLETFYQEHVSLVADSVEDFDDEEDDFEDTPESFSLNEHILIEPTLPLRAISLESYAPIIPFEIERRGIYKKNYMRYLHFFFSNSQIFLDCLLTLDLPNQITKNLVFENNSFNSAIFFTQLPIILKPNFKKQYNSDYSLLSYLKGRNQQLFFNLFREVCVFLFTDLFSPRFNDESHLKMKKFKNIQKYSKTFKQKFRIFSSFRMQFLIENLPLIVVPHLLWDVSNIKPNLNYRILQKNKLWLNLFYKKAVINPRVRQLYKTKIISTQPISKINIKYNLKELHASFLIYQRHKEYKFSIKQGLKPTARLLKKFPSLKKIPIKNFFKMRNYKKRIQRYLNTYKNYLKLRHYNPIKIAGIDYKRWLYRVYTSRPRRPRKPRFFKVAKKKIPIINKNWGYSLNKNKHAKKFIIPKQSLKDLSILMDLGLKKESKYSKLRAFVNIVKKLKYNSVFKLKRQRAYNLRMHKRITLLPADLKLRKLLYLFKYKLKLNLHKKPRSNYEIKYMRLFPYLTYADSLLFPKKKSIKKMYKITLKKNNNRAAKKKLDKQSNAKINLINASIVALRNFISLKRPDRQSLASAIVSYKFRKKHDQELPATLLFFYLKYRFNAKKLNKKEFQQVKENYLESNNKKKKIKITKIKKIKPKKPTIIIPLTLVERIEKGLLEPILPFYKVHRYIRYGSFIIKKREMIFNNTLTQIKSYFKKEKKRKWPMQRFLLETRFRKKRYKRKADPEEVELQFKEEFSKEQVRQRELKIARRAARRAARAARIAAEEARKAKKNAFYQNLDSMRKSPKKMQQYWKQISTLPLTKKLAKQIKYPLKPRKKMPLPSKNIPLYLKYNLKRILKKPKFEQFSFFKEKLRFNFKTPLLEDSKYLATKKPWDYPQYQGFFNRFMEIKTYYRYLDYFKQMKAYYFRKRKLKKFREIAPDFLFTQIFSLFRLEKKTTRIKLKKKQKKLKKKKINNNLFSFSFQVLRSLEKIIFFKNYYKKNTQLKLFTCSTFFFIQMNTALLLKIKNNLIANLSTYRPLKTHAFISFQKRLSQFWRINTKIEMLANIGFDVENIVQNSSILTSRVNSSFQYDVSLLSLDIPKPFSIKWFFIPLIPDFNLKTKVWRRRKPSPFSKDFAQLKYKLSKIWRGPLNFFSIKFFQNKFYIKFFKKIFGIIPNFFIFNFMRVYRIKKVRSPFLFFGRKFFQSLFFKFCSDEYYLILLKTRNSIILRKYLIKKLKFEYIENIRKFVAKCPLQFYNTKYFTQKQKEEFKFPLRQKVKEINFQPYNYLKETPNLTNIFYSKKSTPQVQEEIQKEEFIYNKLKMKYRKIFISYYLFPKFYFAKRPPKFNKAFPPVPRPIFFNWVFFFKKSLKKKTKQSTNNLKKLRKTLLYWRKYLIHRPRRLMRSFMLIKSLGFIIFWRRVFSNFLSFFSFRFSSIFFRKKILVNNFSKISKKNYYYPTKTPKSERNYAPLQEYELYKLLQKSHLLADTQTLLDDYYFNIFEKIKGNFFKKTAFISKLNVKKYVIFNHKEDLINSFLISNFLFKFWHPLNLGKLIKFEFNFPILSFKEHKKFKSFFENYDLLSIYTVDEQLSSENFDDMLDFDEMDMVPTEFFNLEQNTSLYQEEDPEVTSLSIDLDEINFDSAVADYDDDERINLWPEIGPQYMFNEHQNIFLTNMSSGSSFIFFDNGDKNSNIILKIILPLFFCHFAFCHLKIQTIQYNSWMKSLLQKQRMRFFKKKKSKNSFRSFGYLVARRSRRNVKFRKEVIEVLENNRFQFFFPMRNFYKHYRQKSPYKKISIPLPNFLAINKLFTIKYPKYHLNPRKQSKRPRDTEMAFIATSSDPELDANGPFKFLRNQFERKNYIKNIRQQEENENVNEIDEEPLEDSEIILDRADSILFYEPTVKFLTFFSDRYGNLNSHAATVKSNEYFNSLFLLNYFGKDLSKYYNQKNKKKKKIPFFWKNFIHENIDYTSYEKARYQPKILPSELIVNKIVNKFYNTSKKKYLNINNSEKSYFKFAQLLTLQQLKNLEQYSTKKKILLKKKKQILLNKKKNNFFKTQQLIASQPNFLFFLPSSFFSYNNDDFKIAFNSNKFKLKFKETLNELSFKKPKIDQNFLIKNLSPKGKLIFNKYLAEAQIEVVNELQRVSRKKLKQKPISKSYLDLLVFKVACTNFKKSHPNLFLKLLKKAEQSRQEFLYLNDLWEDAHMRAHLGLITSNQYSKLNNGAESTLFNIYPIQLLPSRLVHKLQMTINSRRRERRRYRTLYRSQPQRILKILKQNQNKIGLWPEKAPIIPQVLYKKNKQKPLLKSYWELFNVNNFETEFSFLFLKNIMFNYNYFQFLARKAPVASGFKNLSNVIHPEITYNFPEIIPTNTSYFWKIPGYSSFFSPYEYRIPAKKYRLFEIQKNMNLFRFKKRNFQALDKVQLKKRLVKRYKLKPYFFRPRTYSHYFYSLFPSTYALYDATRGVRQRYLMRKTKYSLNRIQKNSYLNFKFLKNTFNFFLPPQIQPISFFYNYPKQSMLFSPNFLTLNSNFFYFWNFSPQIPQFKKMNISLSNNYQRWARTYIPLNIRAKPLNSDADFADILYLFHYFFLPKKYNKKKKNKHLIDKSFLFHDKYWTPKKKKKNKLIFQQIPFSKKFVETSDTDRFTKPNVAEIPITLNSFYQIFFFKLFSNKQLKKVLFRYHFLKQNIINNSLDKELFQLARFISRMQLSEALFNLNLSTDNFFSNLHRASDLAMLKEFCDSFLLDFLQDSSRIGHRAFFLSQFKSLPISELQPVAVRIEEIKDLNKADPIKMNKSLENLFQEYLYPIHFLKKKNTYNYKKSQIKYLKYRQFVPIYDFLIQNSSVSNFQPIKLFFNEYLDKKSSLSIPTLYYKFLLKPHTFFGPNALFFSHLPSSKKMKIKYDIIVPINPHMKRPRLINPNLRIICQDDYIRKKLLKLARRLELNQSLLLYNKWKRFQQFQINNQLKNFNYNFSNNKKYRILMEKNRIQNLRQFFNLHDRLLVKLHNNKQRGSIRSRFRKHWLPVLDLYEFKPKQKAKKKKKKKLY
jgi:DNA polymerase III delta prime subunit